MLFLTRLDSEEGKGVSVNHYKAREKMQLTKYREEDFQKIIIFCQENSHYMV